MKAMWTVLALGLMTTGCYATEEDVADLVFRGGAVWSGDGSASGATAVAVAGGKVVAVGGDSDVASLIGSGTRVVELGGRSLLPGFIDAHTHFLDGGSKLSGVDLRDADTPEEFARRIGAFARTVPPGTWITGGDWDHEMWGGQLPRREWVDSLTPDHPVFVNRLDGHMALANSAAMVLAGVDADGTTGDPDGGTIVRDPVTGAAAGVFKDEAMAVVARAIPESSDEELWSGVAGSSSSGSAAHVPSSVSAEASSNTQRPRPIVASTTLWYTAS